jgi:hypothetical protein
MRGTNWAIGVAVVLAGTVGLTRGDDEGYDLRGPAPSKGQTLVTRTIFKISKADVTLKSAGQNVKATQTLSSTDEEEIKIIAVDGRQVTNAQTKVTRDKVDTITNQGDGDMNDTKAGDLEGEVIISERTGAGKWKHTLVDNKPTDKQKKELDKRLGPENQDDLYPAGKLKVGHTWTVDATALQRVFGGSITDLKGKLKMKLVKVEEIDGVTCAVIEAAGKITGTTKEDDGDLGVELDLKRTTWRSIKTGIDVKDKVEGRIKASGTVKMDGMEVEVVLEGPVTINSTSKLKSSKSE